MKREHNIRTFLGITQQETAMLLGVHRSQWSMFESGKCDLPLQATQLLAEMLAYVQAPEETDRADAVAQHARHQQHHLEGLLRKNENQQLLMARKIAAAQKKLAADTRLSKLAAFLSSHAATGKAARHHIVVHKASQATVTETSVLVLTYELKQEGLILEKMLLESKMRKFALSLENIGEARNK